MNPSNSFEIEATQTPAYVSGQARLAETDGAFSSRSNEELETPTIGSSLSGIDTSVLSAAENGDIDALQKHSNNLHQLLTATKNTALHIYIASISSRTFSKCEVKKSTNIVKQILDMCPSLLLQPNDNGDIALHVAAREGHAAIVEVIIEAARDRREDPENVGVERVWQMLRTTNKEKVTAMHEAARFNHLGVLRILTREDPDFTYSANEDGETPLYLAAERGYYHLVVEILHTCTHPAYEGRSGRTALHAAVICNSEGMTSKLLEATKCPMTKAVDEQGWTPLHLAAFLGHLSIVKQLLDYDQSAAFIGDKYDNMTALHIAASEGHVHVIKRLISRCPDCCELVDRRGRNVLHYVFKNSLYQVEDFVLKKKWLRNILINGKDVDGNTPLHLLADSLYWGSNFLGDARVDKLALNKKNLNAFDIVAAKNTVLQETEAFKLMLRKNGARPGYHQIKRDEESKIEGVQEKADTCTAGLLGMVKEAKVVAALIATVTFAAGFAVPGGYQSEKGPDQGFPVLIRNLAFKVFVLTNTVAMALSSSSVMMCFLLSAEKEKQMIKSSAWSFPTTFWALVAMVIAFLSGTYAILGHSAPVFALQVCSMGSVYFLIFVSPESFGVNRVVYMMNAIRSRLRKI